MFSCYETLAQLIDIGKSFLIAFDYLNDLTNIVLKIIFPINTCKYLFHIYTGPTNFKTDYVCFQWEKNR